MDISGPVAAGGSLLAAGAATWAAFQSRASSAEANKAANTLASIERDRRHSELTPRLRVSCELWTVGNDKLRLRVALVGPPDLGQIDKFTVSIRDDHFRRRDERLIAETPSAKNTDEILQQVWGPYRFSPGVGTDDARADSEGRATVYNAAMPVGEELPFQLEPTRPPSYATSTSPEQWRQERGSLIRLAFEAENTGSSPWRLACEIDIGDGTHPVAVDVP